MNDVFNELLLFFLLQKQFVHATLKCYETIFAIDIVKESKNYSQEQFEQMQKKIIDIFVFFIKNVV